MAHISSPLTSCTTGMEEILARIPDGGRYFSRSISMAWTRPLRRRSPARAPGGVTFVQARRLIHGLVKKGRVVGMDVVEITPRVDVNRITCITAGPADRKSYRGSCESRLFRQALSGLSGRFLRGGPSTVGTAERSVTV